MTHPTDQDRAEARKACRSHAVTYVGGIPAPTVCGSCSAIAHAIAAARADERADERKRWSDWMLLAHGDLLRGDAQAALRTLATAVRRAASGQPDEDVNDGDGDR